MQWEQIKGNARQVAVTDIRDVVVWGLTANNFFSIKLLYQNLERNISDANNKWIWKEKLPLKIKFSCGNCFGMLF
jgi:hypothetical protein